MHPENSGREGISLVISPYSSPAADEAGLSNEAGVPAPPHLSVAGTQDLGWRVLLLLCHCHPIWVAKMRRGLEVGRKGGVSVGSAGAGAQHLS
jgi:hypothetical protein